MLEFHPLANLFPLIEGRDFEELVADVKANRLREPIMMYEGKILDGRNRYRAGRESGLIDDEDEVIGAHFVAFDTRLQGDPLTWVLSKNLHRRHLSENQRVMIAAEIAQMKQGRPSEWNRGPVEDGKPANRPDLSQGEAAELLNVSERSVRRGRVVVERGVDELKDAVKADRVSVSAAAEVARLPEAEQLEIIRSVKPELVAQVAKDRQRVGAGGRATMQSRVEPPDSLDYFPTPPWATRALIEDVLPRYPIDLLAPGDLGTVWEPACGEGHMSGVLEEYAPRVIATDVFDYTVDGRSPPGWAGVLDFLDTSGFVKDLVDGEGVDWIISNPPFAEQKTLEFALRALRLARKGVALFVRQQWLDTGIERYERLFRDMPPTLYAQFVDRVNLCRGRWDPEGGTATAYCWLVWVKAMADDKLIGPPRVMWIAPGKREQRARADDVSRFTAHPVKPLLRDREAASHLVHTQEIAGASPAPATSSPGLATAEDAPPGPDGATVPAADGGEGERCGSVALPAPPTLSVDEQNHIIRAGYARTPVASIAELSAATGLKPNTVKKRAERMGLSDRENQKAAARRLIDGVNARRRAAATEGASHG